MGTVLPTSACSCTPRWGFWGRQHSSCECSSILSHFALCFLHALLKWSEGASLSALLQLEKCLPFSWRTAVMIQSPGGHCANGKENFYPGERWKTTDHLLRITGGKEISLSTNQFFWEHYLQLTHWCCWFIITVACCSLWVWGTAWAPGKGLCSWGVRTALHRYTRYALCCVNREWE